MTRGWLFLLAAGAAAADPPLPNRLPICALAKDPLSALCQLDGDAMKARFECKKPEPLMFCGKVDEWSCKYMGFAGEKAPPVTFHARFDHQGPPVKDGEILDMKRFKREGRVRGVAVHLEIQDKDLGKRRAGEIGGKLVSWGCTVGDKGYRDKFQCGSWEASVGYNDIIHQVIVEVADTGALDCK